MTTQWPDKIRLGQSRAYQISTLYHNYTESKKEHGIYGYYVNENPDNYLLGYVLPPFQRPPVWSTDQAEKFLESAVLGYHLGFYAYNQLLGERNIAEQDNVDMWLIDGQQRLRALKLLFDNEISVFGAKFNEINDVRRRNFLHTPFGCYETSTNNKQELLDMYINMNFGGTSHTQDQYPEDIT